MNRLGILAAGIGCFLMLGMSEPVFAQNIYLRQNTYLHYGPNIPHPSPWYFDGRDDDADFPNNGFFPGDFAADPATAAFHTVQSVPYRSDTVIVIENTPQPPYGCRRHRHRASCNRAD
jgi:hypothetical protein